MGVPAFYRWILEKYPKCVVDCVEQRPVVLEGERHFELVDVTGPNPNGFEVDNLYIDMNGLIHPCAHPENGEPPKTEEEMYLRVMAYVDRLVAAVRPRRVLYLAIDGVAPRAKMNQQRARRFRSAQEAEQRMEVEKEAIEYMKAMGHKVVDKQEKGWDSNVITPGTKFMSKLAKYLRFYIRDRINNNEAWKNIKVIFSDAGVPGEGEHKLMQYIRVQRSQPGYDPNQYHVLHGLDADLIMLGLATHEVKFSILREEVLFGKKKYEKENAQKIALDANGIATAGSSSNHKRKRGEFGEHDGDIVILPENEKPLQFLHIAILREYLSIEFEPLAKIVPFGYDFERIIDDFVFLCFFVGNDFLPHLPSLDIRDGALDFLILIYAKLLPALGGYLTNTGEVDLEKVDILLAQVGAVEDIIFQRRAIKQQENEKRRKQQRLTNAQKDQIGAQAVKEDAIEIVKKRRIDQNLIEIDQKYGGLTAEEAIKARIKETVENQLEKYREEVQDIVRLGEPGWKTRYYQDKLKSNDIEHGGGREKVFQKYIEGLCWVMKYYYSGCASWQWFYPFHYAPFASDLKNIERYQIQFEIGQPFRPFEQLMGVFPADSAHSIPKPYRWLMKDPESPIIDFYPKEIPVDPNGKAMPWLWVVLLPFIDESRLLDAMEKPNQQLTETEKKRNERFGKEIIFYHATKCPVTSVEPPNAQVTQALADPKISKSFYGTLIFCEALHFAVGTIVPSPQKSQQHLMDIHNNHCLSFEYKLPPKNPHICKILEKAQIPPTVLLSEEDRRITIPFFGKANINIVDLAGGAVTAARNRFQNRQSGGYNQQQRGYQSRGEYSNNNLNVHRYQQQEPPQYNQYLTNGFGNWGSQEPRNKRGGYESSGYGGGGRGSNNNPYNNRGGGGGAGYNGGNRYDYHGQNRNSGSNISSSNSYGNNNNNNSYSNRGGYNNQSRGGRDSGSGAPIRSAFGGASLQGEQSYPSQHAGKSAPPRSLEALKAGLRNMHQQRNQFPPERPGGGSNNSGGSRNQRYDR
jgi:5'-3' exoribonuclease 2